MNSNYVYSREWMLLKLFNWVISKKEATKIEILKLQSHQKKGTINQEKISLRVLNSLSWFQDLGTKFFIMATIQKYKLQSTTNLYREITMTQNSIRHNVALGIQPDLLSKKIL